MTDLCNLTLRQAQGTNTPLAELRRSQKLNMSVCEFQIHIVQSIINLSNRSND
jgi:hypothetical protein